MTKADVKGDTKGLSRHDLDATLDGGMDTTLDGGMGRLSHWMEQMVQEAQARGDFTDLPGKGRPLSLPDYDPYAGPEAAVYGALKNAGFTPEWVEWRRQIVDEINWLRANGAHPERPSRIVTVNILIAKHNRQVPNATLQLPKLPGDFGR